MQFDFDVFKAFCGFPGGLFKSRGVLNQPPLEILRNEVQSMINKPANVDDGAVYDKNRHRHKPRGG